MPDFTVRIPVTGYAVTVITADSAEEAKAIGLELIGQEPTEGEDPEESPWDFEWDTDGDGEDVEVEPYEDPVDEPEEPSEDEPEES